MWLYPICDKKIFINERFSKVFKHKIMPGKRYQKSRENNKKILEKKFSGKFLFVKNEKKDFIKSYYQKRKKSYNTFCHYS